MSHIASHTARITKILLIGRSCIVLIMAAGCASRDADDWYAQREYARQGQISLSLWGQDQETQTDLVMSFSGVYDRHAQLVRDGEIDMRLVGDEIFAVAGQGQGVMSGQQIGRALQSGSLVLGSGSVQTTFAAMIIQDLIQSQSLVMSQEISIIDDVHAWRSRLQRKSFALSETGLALDGHCQYTSNQQDSLYQCDDRSLIRDDKTWTYQTDNTIRKGGYKISRKPRQGEIMLPSVTTLDHILSGNNQK